MHWIWPALVKRKPKVERLSQGSANASTVTDPVTRDGSDRGVPVRVLRRPVIRPDVQLLRLAIVAEGGD